MLLVLAAILYLFDPFFQRGIQEIQISPGRSLYFKREVRGLLGNYDILTISLNPDPCAEYDGSVDAEFPAIGSHAFYYRVLTLSNKVELQGVTDLTLPPRGGLSDLLHYEVLHPLDWRSLEETWQSQGLKFLEVPVNPWIVCF